MKIFFHNDPDGRAAGAVAWRSPLVNRSSIYEVIEIDYKTVETGNFDFNTIHPNELLIIVDFSFKPRDMSKILAKTSYIIWLDHHLTSLEYKYGIGISGKEIELSGIRDKNFSGCELAWKYFFPDDKMPQAIEYIGDRDKWAFNFGQASVEFVEGLHLYPHQPKDPIWDLLLGSPAGYAGNREYVEFNKILEEGKLCVKYRDSICEDYIKSFGFETMFEGHKSFALGLMAFGSDAFGSRIKDYELLLTFEFDGKNYTVGVYSESVDVSKICEKYGGGGHAGAGGFLVKELPFINEYSAFSAIAKTEIYRQQVKKES
ncbi:hypothetical protein A2Z67_04495 [Candidatus Woesebacteria bacterium RBG_13_36_22]|uniref:DHHA1 domain-containing protein n=1 Tax=Candidatus Woesebacteria bacterium RBG_13_36_22 TaxID=1802478 RepID=A0A1F7X261_9BACT|nr:MAG: hypothetical protein A2Z67_04495 [Candidatus Woesebacteria bacterium RBG_13_36_22]